MLITFCSCGTSLPTISMLLLLEATRRHFSLPITLRLERVIRESVRSLHKELTDCWLLTADTLHPTPSRQVGRIKLIKGKTHFSFFNLSFGWLFESGNYWMIDTYARRILSRKVVKWQRWQKWLPLCSGKSLLLVKLRWIF